MKVSCPSCSATLNIDEKKVPAGGARIKCPTCTTIFPVRPGQDAAAPGSRGSGVVPLPGAAGGPPPLPKSSGSGAVPLPGGLAAIPLPSASAPQPWETETTRAMPVNDALAAAAAIPLPGSNLGAPTVMTDLGGDIPLPGAAPNYAGAVPLPGGQGPRVSAKTLDIGGWQDESTRAIQSDDIPMADPSDAIDDFSSVPLPGGADPGSVPLPGGAAQDFGGGAFSFDAPAAPTAAPGSIPLPGGADPFEAPDFGMGAPAPAAPMGNIPLPGAADFSVDMGANTVAYPSQEAPTSAIGMAGSPHAATAISDNFMAPPAPAAPGGFDFSAPVDAPAAAPGGFDFSAPAVPPPPPAPTGFDFSAPAVPPPPPAPTGFDFAAPAAPPAMPPDVGSAFDFSAPQETQAAAGAPPANDFGFDFAAPAPPAPSNDFGFGAPPANAAPTSDNLEFNPAPAAAADPLEADFSAPPPASSDAPAAPADGLEMLSFIDDEANKLANEQNVGSQYVHVPEPTGPARRFHIKRRSGKVFGPFEEAVIAKMLEDGQLLGNEEISPDGEAWQPIGTEASFQAVISKLMEGPAAGSSTETINTDDSAVPTSASSSSSVDNAPGSDVPKGPSMERLKQVYEGRMAAVAVVQSKEPFNLKKKLPLIAAGGALFLVASIGIFAGVATPYGFFFLKSLFPATIKADTREFQYIAAAKKDFEADTFKAYKDAKVQASQALVAKEYPEARAVWAQAIYLLKRKYNFTDAQDPSVADQELDNIALLGKKHVEYLRTLASSALTKNDPATALINIDEALAREDNQDDAELRFLRAEALLMQKPPDREQAKAEYTQILKKVPTSAKALHALGLVLRSPKTMDEAMAQFAKALEADPKHVSSAVELAEIQLLEKHDAEAAKKTLAALESKEAKADLAPAEVARALALQGEVLVMDNKPTEALPVFEQAIATDGANAFVKARLGKTYMLLNEPEKAVPLLKGAADANPDNLDNAQTYLSALIAVGKMDEATRVVAAVNQKFPGNAMLAYLSARVSDVLDRSKEAEDAYRRAIAADPGITDAYLYLARLLIRFRRYNDAAPILTQGLERDPKNGALHVGVGELALNERNFEKAETEFDIAIENAPNLAEGYLGKSRVQLVNKQFEEAAVNVDKALELNPRIRGGRLQRGVVLWKLGKLDEALGELEKAKEAEPRDMQILVTLGAVEFERKQYQNALTYLSNASNAERAPPDAFFYLARLKNARGENGQAIETMKRALDFDSKNPLYRYWMGRIYFDAKRLEDAIVEWKLTLEIDPKNPDALEAMGRINFDRAKLKVAIDFFLKTLESAPDRTTVRMLVADAYMTLEQWDDAIDVYKTILSREPESKENNVVYYRLGKCFEEKKKHKEAISWYQRATELDQTNGDAWQALGFLLKDGRKYKEAIAAFAKYLEVKPDAMNKKEIQDEIFYMKQEK